MRRVAEEGGACGDAMCIYGGNAMYIYGSDAMYVYVGDAMYLYGGNAMYVYVPRGQSAPSGRGGRRVCSRPRSALRASPPPSPPYAVPVYTYVCVYIYIYVYIHICNNGHNIEGCMYVYKPRS